MSRYRLPEEHDEPYIPEEDDPDWEFSEARGYADWEPPRRPWLRPLIIGVSLLLLAGLLLPAMLRLAS